MEDVGQKMTELMEKYHWEEKVRSVYKEVLKSPEIVAFIKEHHDELDADEIRRSMSKFIEYLNFKKDRDAGKKTFMPGYCPKLIMSSIHVQIVYLPTKENLKQKQQRKIKQRVRTISVPKSIKNASLQEYGTMTKGRAAALKQALLFVRSYVENPNEFHKGLYLEGKFGVGKTYLLGAIANDLAENGFSTTILHVPTFISDLKALLGDKTTGRTVADAVNEVKNAPVLMLDDIGADSLSNWSRDDILGVILQHRMQEELPTFFSSNLSMEELESSYLTFNNRMESDPLKAKRIMERIKFLATEIIVDGPNLRND